MKKLKEKKSGYGLCNKVKIEIYCRPPKFLRKMSEQRYYYKEFKLTERTKGQDPVGLSKILLAQSKLIKLFSCQHIKTMLSCGL